MNDHVTLHLYFGMVVLGMGVCMSSSSLHHVQVILMGIGAFQRYDCIILILPALCGFSHRNLTRLLGAFVTIFPIVDYLGSNNTKGIQLPGVRFCLRFDNICLC